MSTAFFCRSDAFTGERHDQRSPAFEKGSLIFNYAALCSQIAAGCVCNLGFSFKYGHSDGNFITL